MPDYELPWSGEPFSAPILAFDTETSVYRPHGEEYDLSREIPPIVLATVSDGQRSAVIHPAQLPEFVHKQYSTLLVGHNIQFDYWVVRNELGARGQGEVDGFAVESWEYLPGLGRMDDTMLLDFLVRLAQDRMEGDTLRNLGKVAATYGLEADKESPYRKRFGELVGQDWGQVDRGYFDYAIEDARVTWHVYDRMIRLARELAGKQGVQDSCIQQYGLLTSKLQTRASIVLSAVGRAGMRVDTEKVSAALLRLGPRAQELVTALDQYEPKIFGTYKTHSKKKVKYREFLPSLKGSGKCGLPKICNEHLTSQLQFAAFEGGLDAGLMPMTPKTGRLNLSAEIWQTVLPNHPFVSQWAELKQTEKVMQFLSDLKGKREIHPKYNPIVRTGRTSCSKPNLQQMPRETWFRENFVARPGCLFVVADYSAIELVTLAAVLESRFGKSVLADVLRQGRKPHDYTASLMTGISYEDMVAGVKREKEEGITGPHAKARQAAKAINFGVPGGLGPDKLVAYAKTNYGVDLLKEQAVEFRRRLVEGIYPELRAYLNDPGMENIARNLHIEPAELYRAFQTEPGTKADWEAFGITNVIARGGKRKDGANLPLCYRKKVWETLQRLNKNPELDRILSSWESTARNHHRIGGREVTTLTGRVRGGADYGEARNTPFQGLAADGAKCALWAIHQAGYRIVHFVHDEIVCEVHAPIAEEAKDHIVSLMQESMRGVLQADLPVEVEAVLSKTWSK